MCLITLLILAFVALNRTIRNTLFGYAAVTSTLVPCLIMTHSNRISYFRFNFHEPPSSLEDFLVRNMYENVRILHESNRLMSCDTRANGQIHCNEFDDNGNFYGQNSFRWNNYYMPASAESKAPNGIDIWQSGGIVASFSFGYCYFIYSRA